jgi:hypothetical protein
MPTKRRANEFEHTPEEKIQVRKRNDTKNPIRTFVNTGFCFGFQTTLTQSPITHQTIKNNSMEHSFDKPLYG